MKKILILLLTSSLFSANFENPNGKPFTLTIGGKYYPRAEFDFTMPVASSITLKAGANSGDIYIGGELHLPLYILWQ